MPSQTRPEPTEAAPAPGGEDEPGVRHMVKRTEHPPVLRADGERRVRRDVGQRARQPLCETGMNSLEIEHQARIAIGRRQEIVNREQLSVAAAYEFTAVPQPPRAERLAMPHLQAPAIHVDVGLDQVYTELESGSQHGEII